VFQNIEDLQLSVRALNCLKSIPIHTVDELLAVDTTKLTRAAHLSQKTAREINDVLCNLHVGRSSSVPAQETILVPLNQEEPKHEKVQIGIEDCRYPRLLLDIVELNLSVRAMNCLRNSNVRYIGDIVSRTEEELLTIRSLGWKSAREIRRKLSVLNLDLGSTVVPWPPTDLSEKKGALAEKIREVRESEAKRLIKMIPRKAGFLEDELAGILERYTRENNGDILGKLLGWDGKGEKTLESIGAEYGYTREWIRQVRKRFERTLGLSSVLKYVQPPALEKALKCIGDNLPIEEGRMVSKLSSLGITRSFFNVEGIATACKVLGRKIPFTIKEFRGRRFLLSAGAEVPVKKLVALAINSVRKYGIASVHDILAKSKDTLRWQGDYRAVVPTLSLRDDFRWLDERKGWFWFDKVPNNRLLNMIKKMLSVSNEINISELRVGIGKCRRMDGIVPPQAILLELCRQLPFCRVDGRKVIADPRLDWEAELKGTSEWAICAIFKEGKALLTYEELETECLGLGMTQGAFNTHLFVSPIVIRYAPKIYGLIGTKVPTAIINNAAFKGGCKKRKVESGWTEDKKIWIVRQLTRGDLIFGSFYIPASLRQFVVGQYRIKSNPDSTPGTLIVKDRMATGMRNLYSSLGAEPGDHIALLYDLSQREVTIHLGNDDLRNKFLSYA